MFKHSNEERSYFFSAWTKSSDAQMKAPSISRPNLPPDLKRTTNVSLDGWFSLLWFLNGPFGGGGVVFPDPTNWLTFLGIEIFQEISSASPNRQAIQWSSAEGNGFSEECSVSVLRWFGRKRNLAPTILFLKISISEVSRGSGHCCSSFLLTFSLGAYWASQL